MTQSDARIDAQPLLDDDQAMRLAWDNPLSAAELDALAAKEDGHWFEDDPMSDEPWMTCVHRESGLCPECQATYDYDPDSWIEYGDHQEGIRRFRELLAELDARVAAKPPEAVDRDIPF